MPTEYSNFTNPDDPNKPVGTGQNIPRPPPKSNLRPDGTYAHNVVPPGSGPPQMGPGGVSSMSGGNYNPRTGMGDPTGATLGNINDPLAFGGTSGEVVLGPDGKPRIDTSLSSRGKMVADYQATAGQAANRDAYQMNYAQGDQDRAGSLATRDRQAGATNMLDAAARGAVPSGAVMRGANASDDSLAAALGAQAGARGTTGQAAASRRGMAAGQAQQLGVAGHLGGARHGELTAARGAFSQGANAQRSGDYQQQALEQQRAKAKYENEMGQRELNQKRQIGYEGLAYDTNEAAMNAGLKEVDRNAGILGTSLQREQRSADRMASFYNSSINAAGKLGQSMGGDDEPDPSKKKV